MNRAEAPNFNGKLFRSPGRVNIIGEHTDYNDGLVLPTNTALYTWISARPRLDKTVQVTARDFDDTQSFSLDDIRRSDKPGWLDYIKGVAAQLQEEGVPLCGADLVIEGDIPIGGGLSSSASLELAAGVALLDMAGAKLPAERLAVLCQQAEQRYAGVNCGIMDQYSVGCCRRGAAMMLDCRSLETTDVELPETLAMVLTDSGVKHKLTGGGYNDRAEECRQAVELITGIDPSVQSLRDVSATSLPEYENQLGDRLFRRSRHVVAEIHRVTEAFSALQTGDISALGALVSASHASLRDDFEISCDEIETLVGIADACEGVVGSRMVGGGFGGCVVTLLRTDQLDHTMKEISESYGAIIGKTPWIHAVTPTEPAGAVDSQ